jgi:hypothetical protein
VGLNFRLNLGPLMYNKPLKKEPGGSPWTFIVFFVLTLACCCGCGPIAEWLGL